MGTSSDPLVCLRDTGTEVPTSQGSTQRHRKASPSQPQGRRPTSLSQGLKVTPTSAAGGAVPEGLRHQQGPKPQESQQARPILGCRGRPSTPSGFRGRTAAFSRLEHLHTAGSRRVPCGGSADRGGRRPWRGCFLHVPHRSASCVCRGAGHCGTHAAVDGGAGLGASLI